MKRLSVFSLRSFLGPFIATLLVSLFMLLMQFFWKYIDDFMGKGIGLPILAELIVYVCAGLIPLALPLTVLLSSIMMMGNLAENNELTALKSSGLSLARIMRPLFIFMIFLAGFTFYFSNYVIPRAEFKSRALIYDITNTKLSLLFQPNKFIRDLQGYVIKLGAVDKNKFKEVKIYDETRPGYLRVIYADSAVVFHEAGGKHLLFQLFDGEIHEEVPMSSPQFAQNGRSFKRHFYPSTKYRFKESTFKVEMEGFEIERSDENSFAHNYELMNVWQLSSNIDSSKMRADTIRKRFSDNLTGQHPYFSARDFIRQNDFLEHQIDTNFFPNGIQIVKLADLNNSQIDVAKAAAANSVKVRRDLLVGQMSTNQAQQNELRNIEAEFHKKFALSYSILVLFLIGAPLGAIVKKGGFGMPVIVATLLFLVYYVLTMIGENMLKAGAIDPIPGIWMSSFILTPIAILVYLVASKDMTFKEWFKSQFKFRKKR